MNKTKVYEHKKKKKKKLTQNVNAQYLRLYRDSRLQIKVN